jgi:hypothetical protein
LGFGGARVLPRLRKRFGHLGMGIGGSIGAVVRQMKAESESTRQDFRDLRSHWSLDTPIALFIRTEIFLMVSCELFLRIESPENLWTRQCTSQGAWHSLPSRGKLSIQSNTNDEIYDDCVTFLFSFSGI